MEKKHYYWLDLLRFLSALIVVIAHCRANFFEIFGNLETASKTIYVKMFYFLTSFSDDAVLVFFILSGFLVGGKILESISIRRPVSPGEFAIKRSVRIGLPLVGSVLFIVLVDNVIGANTSWEGILCNALSLQCIFSEFNSMGGPLWTMPYIVWNYVLLYSIVLLSHKRYTVSGTIVLALVLLVFSLTYGGKSTYMYFFVLLGTLAYVISQRSLPKLFVFLCAFVAIAAAVLTKFAKPSISREASFLSTLNVPMLQVLETMSIAILIGKLVTITPRGKFFILLNKYSTKLAVFSYSLYLIHYQLIRLMTWVGFPKLKSIDSCALVLFISEVCLCILGGYLFYLCIEKHTGRMQRTMVSFWRKLDHRQS
jgi:hypothetical protein